ncbi:MAG: hypothetical protein ACHQJ5_09200 [Vicinamibacteria bacterium]|jgi:hypothetical protein
MSIGAKRGRALAAAATGVVLVFAGIAYAAPGDVVFSGSTSEGVNVKLTVATAGNATKFKVGKTSVECAEGGTLTNKAGTYSGFDVSDPGAFSDKSSSKSSSGGYDFKTKSTLKGQLSGDQASWAGTLKLVTKVFKHGQKVDTCKLSTAWTAG